MPVRGSWRSVPWVALAALALASHPASGGIVPPEVPQATRVIYLGEIDSGSAMRELRGRVGVAHIAVLERPCVVVLRDRPESLERSEAVLRELGEFESAVEPHPPIASRRPPEAPIAERRFAFPAGDAKSGLTLARALYGAKAIELVEGDPPALVVRDTEAILDAVAALFTELGLLDAAELAPCPAKDPPPAE